MITTCKIHVWIGTVQSRETGKESNFKLTVLIWLPHCVTQTPSEEWKALGGIAVTNGNKSVLNWTHFIKAWPLAVWPT